MDNSKRNYDTMLSESKNTDNINSKKKIKTENFLPKILYIDIDETIASRGAFDIIINLWLHFKEIFPPKEIFIGDFLNKGVFRKGITEFMQHLSKMKIDNVIEDIIIYTSSPNQNQRVEYFIDCLIEFTGVPKDTITHIFTRENSKECEIAPCGATFKDLRIAFSLEKYSNLKCDTDNCLIVDDKPSNIKQFKDGKKDCVIKVSEFKCDVHPIDILKKAPWFNKTIFNNCVEEIKNEKRTGIYNIPNQYLETDTGLTLETITYDSKSAKPNYDSPAINDGFSNIISRINNFFNKSVIK